MSQKSTTRSLFGREGVASRAALLAAGLSANTIRCDLRAGRYHAVHTGVYALGPLSPRGRLVAALFAGGPDACLCFASALTPYRLNETRATIDVAVPAKRTSSPLLRLHRLSLTEDEVTTRDGLRTTTIPRTLLDLAGLPSDVRFLVQETLAKRLTTKTKLLEIAEHHPRHHGSKRLARAAGAPHTRSRLERRFLEFLTAHGLAHPVTNLRLGRYTVDGYYEDARLVIELDETGGHDTPLAFEVDRERDNHHAARGRRTMRITETALDRHGNRIARQLSEALASGAT